MAEADPKLGSDTDWRGVARLVLTSREMDRIEEEELVPAKQVLYQFSARGHDMAQVLLGLHLRDGDAACGYYRSRPLLLALGAPLAHALGSRGAPAGGRAGLRRVPPPAIGAGARRAAGRGARFWHGPGWGLLGRARHRGRVQ